MNKVVKYTKEHKDCWDSFVSNAKNQSFLFRRDFMEYHSDRFSDHSLMVYNNEKLIAVIPANLHENELISHQGLTYGGIIINHKMVLCKLIDLVKVVLEYLVKKNIHIWTIKLIPRIYHNFPSDELDWILFKLKSQLIRRDTTLVIDNRIAHIPYQLRRKRSIKKVPISRIQLKKGFDEIEPFWSKILVPNLLSKHGVRPVHEVEEILLLASRFPENIQQHNIYLDNTIVAGCTMFLNNTVAHAQYISGSQSGRELGCLDYLFDFLIKEEYRNYNYFDFGICNEKDGLKLNKGLLDWKEGFGARIISSDFYRIDTSSFVLLELDN